MRLVSHSNVGHSKSAMSYAVERQQQQGQEAVLPGLQR